MTAFRRLGYVENIYIAKAVLASTALIFCSMRWESRSHSRTTGRCFDGPQPLVCAKSLSKGIRMSLTLYAHPFAAYCWKTLIALYENATPFTYRLIEDATGWAELESLWPIKKLSLIHI